MSINLLKKTYFLKDKGKENAAFKDTPNLLRFVNFMKKCKISRPYYIQDKKVFIRDLTGREYLLLFAQFEDFEKLFPTMKQGKKIQFILTEFYNIYVTVKDNLYCNNENELDSNKRKSELIKAQTFNWLNKFVEVFHQDQITPYMHIFTQHLHEFIAIHGNINLFTMQGKILIIYLTN